jgi:hypothetical protein
MPERDAYFTVQAHTIVRQYLDYQHWYDRQKLTLKEIRHCQFVLAMNQTAGTFTIDSRLQRHFATFAVPFPSKVKISSRLKTIGLHLFDGEGCIANDLFENTRVTLQSLEQDRSEIVEQLSPSIRDRGDSVSSTGGQCVFADRHQIPLPFQSERFHEHHSGSLL